ncbi:unnamed protein product [Microthlaspi erraticum]|uniref:Transposase Tnp1/En/Spm-like domain-containing protein n=1 Tax=Microthlaspi erraticum TaxID=1685480 RepID=A0A6D2KDW1_9BRAS|nr:unnamed protein product [Microthlaspi erraticum]
MVRLAEDLKKESSEPHDLTRLKVWVKSRTKKDGTPVNIDAADKIQKATKLVDSQDPSSTSSNPKEDLLTQVLGPDNPGRFRAMGRGMSISKFACFQMKNKYMTEMQQTQVHLQQQVQDLQEALATMKNQRHETEVGENSAPRSVNKKSHIKCILYDWSASDEKVAEGHILSSDPEEFVNEIPLGPNSVKVLVETGVKTEAFLWRPAPNMFTVGEAVGEIIAWPQSFTAIFENEEAPEDIAPKSPSISSPNLCKIMDWTNNDEEIVAEGRWQTRDPKALVNGLPLGPNAIKVFVDAVLNPDTFLWRPTAELLNLEDSLKSFVAWPVNKISFVGQNTEPPVTSSTADLSATTPRLLRRKANQLHNRLLRYLQLNLYISFLSEADGCENLKCILMDVTGEKRVVAEGRWSSNNPTQVVHFIPLGENAVRVWVDVVKVGDAKLWRPSSFMDCMEDAIGTTVAWPEDKILIVIRFRVKGKSRGKQHFSGLTLTSQLDRVEAWPVELRNSTGWSSRRSSWSSRWLLPSSFAYPVELRPCAKSLHAPCPICSRMLQKTYFKGPNMHMYANAT